MKRIVTALIVDPSPLFREGLRRILGGASYRPVQTAASVDEVAAETLADPELSLCIVGMGTDREAALQAIHRVKGLNPSLPVVLLGPRCDNDFVVAALKAGAGGFLLKNVSCEALLKSLDLVVLGEVVVPAAFFHHQAIGELPQAAETTHMTDIEPPSAIEPATTAVAPATHRLSNRETTILRDLVQGASNKCIARRLEITEATVKVHIKGILRKIQAKNRTQAAIWAINHLVERRNSAQESDDISVGHRTRGLDGTVNGSLA